LMVWFSIRFELKGKAKGLAQYEAPESFADKNFQQFKFAVSSNNYVSLNINEGAFR
jgi:hypothetical protein